MCGESCIILGGHSDLSKNSPIYSSPCCDILYTNTSLSIYTPSVTISEQHGRCTETQPYCSHFHRSPPPLNQPQGTLTSRSQTPNGPRSEQAVRSPETLHTSTNPPPPPHRETPKPATWIPATRTATLARRDKVMSCGHLRLGQRRQRRARQMDPQGTQ